MNAKQSFYSICQSSLNGELYQDRRPATDGSKTDIEKTYGIFSVIGGPSFNTLSGSSGIDRIRIQLSIFSLNADSRDSAMNACIAAMEQANDNANTCVSNGQDPYNTAGAQFNLTVSVPIDGYEEDTEKYYSHCDFYLWQKD